jgi:hypothetical protein
LAGQHQHRRLWVESEHLTDNRSEGNRQLRWAATQIHDAVVATQLQKLGRAGDQGDWIGRAASGVVSGRGLEATNGKIRGSRHLRTFRAT